MNKSEENKYQIHPFHDCIDAYKDVDKPEDWLECPRCKLKPKVWEFDNGRFTACGCYENTYKGFSVSAKPIVAVMKDSENRQDMTNYDKDELKNNWNNYCKNYIAEMGLSTPKDN